MSLPVEIDYHNLQSSPTVDALIHERADKLLRFHGRLQRCHVVLEQPHRHHRQGNPYHVRVRLDMPGNTLVSSHDEDNGHPDLYAAVRNAFDRAARQLEDWVDKSRRGAPGAGAAGA